MSGAQFWRITAPRGTLLLRRWPPEHPSAERLRFIHAVLHHAALRGIKFIPLPIATRDQNSFVEHAGHLWELTPWLPGTADYERTPSIDKLRAALTALAQFHTAVSDITYPRTVAGDLRVAGETPAITRRLTRLHELAHGGIHDLSQAVTPATWPDLAPLARQFLAALPRALPQAIAQLEPLAAARLPIQVCLRDIWHDHVLFTGSEVTGLIDFGAVAIDTPATDIARLLGSLADTPLPTREGPGEGSQNRDAWQIGLAAYTATRPLSPQESLAARALNAAAPILAGCNWLRWIYVERRQFENRAQIVERFRRTASPIAAGSQPRSGDIA